MAEAVAEPSAAALLAEARERTDRRLAEWAERLRREVGGRDGEAFAYAHCTPASGCAGPPHRVLPRGRRPD
jgi:hypothetical protein